MEINIGNKYILIASSAKECCRHGVRVGERNISRTKSFLDGVLFLFMTNGLRSLRPPSLRGKLEKVLRIRTLSHFIYLFSKKKGRHRSYRNGSRKSVWNAAIHRMCYYYSYLKLVFIVFGKSPPPPSLPKLAIFDLSQGEIPSGKISGPSNYVFFGNFNTTQLFRTLRERERYYKE